MNCRRFGLPFFVLATLATSPLAAQFSPPAGVLPFDCAVGLAGMGNDAPLTPELAQKGWDALTLDVAKEFEALKATNDKADPAHRRSGPDMHAEAVARVRAKLRAAGDLPVLHAFDTYVGQAERGRKELESNLEIFANPTPHLEKGKLSREETREFLKRAYAFLIQNGENTPNMAHIGDHLATYRALEGQLRRMGLDAEEVELAMMIHDLGKEFQHLPPSYRTFLQSVFPDGKKDFAAQQIMAHEFGSMAAIDRIGQEMGLSAEKLNRLKALIARHNAGYDPDLPGNHFWNGPFGWAPFAKRFAERTNGVPPTYSAVLPTDAGGHPTTVVLTAIDRAASYTLASQEKFAPFLLNMKKWTNAGLADQVIQNAKNVGAEVENVLGKLKPTKDMPEGQVRDLQAAVKKAFAADVDRLSKLGEELPKMAKAEGAYDDGVELVKGLPEQSIVYRSRDGRWHRVDADGKYYVANGAKTKWEAAEGTPLGTDAPTRLFRNAIFPDFGYRPRFIGDYAPQNRD